MFIDSHAHLTDKRFEGEVDAVLSRAREAGVEAIVTIATRLADSHSAADLADREPDVFSTAGLHPHNVEEATDEAFSEIRELAARPKVVAIGETGLDYYYDNAPRALQRQSFERHLQLGAELGLPVVVHAREADDDVRAILRAAPPVPGVLHCFSSGPVLMETALELGWYISFAGMITFSRFDGHDLLRAVPVDRLLVETDSPYLAPVPHRGKRNEPAFVIHTARMAAEICGEFEDFVRSATTANARTLYQLES